MVSCRAVHATQERDAEVIDLQRQLAEFETTEAPLPVLAYAGGGHDDEGRERVAQLERQLQLQLQGRCLPQLTVSMWVPVYSTLVRISKPSAQQLVDRCRASSTHAAWCWVVAPGSASPQMRTPRKSRVDGTLAAGSHAHMLRPRCVHASSPHDTWLPAGWSLCLQHALLPCPSSGRSRRTRPSRTCCEALPSQVGLLPCMCM